jgi:hypothetical protein
MVAAWRARTLSICPTPRVGGKRATRQRSMGPNPTAQRADSRGRARDQSTTYAARHRRCALGPAARPAEGRAHAPAPAQGPRDRRSHESKPLRAPTGHCTQTSAASSFTEQSESTLPTRRLRRRGGLTPLLRDINCWRRRRGMGGRKRIEAPIGDVRAQRGREVMSAPTGDQVVAAHRRPMAFCRPEGSRHGLASNQLSAETTYRIPVGVRSMPFVRLRPSASGRRIALRHCRATSRSIDRSVRCPPSSCTHGCVRSRR